ncbi:MAG: hypothetical protein H7070_01630 [Saprospiraceae bacterium]|nr:hypothetical protein [Pyrinomonadaceae bacterium]
MYCLKFILSSIILITSAGSSFGQRSNEPRDFAEVVKTRVSQIKVKDVTGRSIRTLGLEDVCPVGTNAVARRVFAEYGAVFVAAGTVNFPTRCVFESEAEVQAFQSTFSTRSVNLNGATIELQSAAMDAFLEARKEGEQKNLRITPRGGSSAGRRSYMDTARIWNSRFLPALIHWGRLGKIASDDAEAARNMSTQQQVEQVMEWESLGLYFATDFSRTIFSSVAAPGTSQHLSMLALDVAQFENAGVRSILNKHGWFQTIANDTPHFTFLGFKESELPDQGLKAYIKGGYKFWVPNIRQELP